MVDLSLLREKRFKWEQKSVQKYENHCENVKSLIVVRVIYFLGSKQFKAQ